MQLFGIQSAHFFKQRFGHCGIGGGFGRLSDGLNVLKYTVAGGALDHLTEGVPQQANILF